MLRGRGRGDLGLRVDWGGAERRDHEMRRDVHMGGTGTNTGYTYTRKGMAAAVFIILVHLIQWLYC